MPILIELIYILKLDRLEACRNAGREGGWRGRREDGGDEGCEGGRMGGNKDGKGTRIGGREDGRMG